MISHVNLIHVLFSGPLLIWIGATKPENKWIYMLLLLLGVLLMVAFLWKSFSIEISQRHVWFIIHAVLFAPLLIYVGWNGSDAVQVSFSLLLAVGIAAFGYHSFRIVSKILDKAN